MTPCYDIGDRRRVLESEDCAPTLISKMGTGGNNVPLVVRGGAMSGEQVVCFPLDMDKLKPSKNTEESLMKGSRKGGCGFGVGNDGDPAYTVNTIDKHGVAVVGFDVYNMADTGEISKTLNAKRSDADHTPVVACCAVRMGHTAANGWGVDEEVAHTHDHAGSSEAVAYAFQPGKLTRNSKKEIGRLWE